jgi:opacity protein-like surface antigen
MKKILVASLVFLFASQLFANKIHENKESKYYVVVKALNILGDNVKHGEAELQGDNGYGFGVDFGYRLQKGFSVEYDFSYSTNDVTELLADELPTTHNATYMTHAIDIVYGYEVIKKMEIFVKAGYEYELEKIDDLNIDNGSDGAVFGTGVEYELNHNYRLLGEYEHSTIDGPRGDSLYLGLMLNF